MERNAGLTLLKVEVNGDPTFAHYYNALLAESEDETDWVLIDTGGFDDFKQLTALGPVDNHLEAMSAATRFQHAA